MFHEEKSVRIHTLFVNQSLIMENKGEKLDCPCGTTGRIREQSSLKEKFLISVTKHREIKITVLITYKDSNIMLINSFPSISKATIRLINTLVV